MKNTEIKQYVVVIEGITPILQHRRAEVEKVAGPRKDITDAEKVEVARYFEKKIGYYQPSDQIKTVLILASHRIKVPGEGNTKYSKYVKPGLIVTPDKIPHMHQKQIGFHKFPTVNQMGMRQSQVWAVLPKIDNWALEFKIDNLLPELLSKDLIKQFLETSGLLFGLGPLRPERGRNFGRFELKGIKEV